MLGRTNTGGGGGVGSLNFQIVGGTTAPSNPKENTIWINTDEKITSWIFSATAPSSPVPDMVWIYIGASSTVEFNAMKKNGIMVYPISAQQYVGGTWEDKTAKSYQGGSWTEWVIYLFKNGNQYIPMTGGWGTGYRTNSAFQALSATIGNTLSFSVSRQSGKVNVCQIAATNNGIDLTDVKKLRFNVSAFSGGSNYTRIGIAKSLDFTNSSTIVKYASVNGTGDVYLDTSTVTGSYYVFCGISSNWGVDGGMSTSAKVSEIECVK